MNEAVKAAYKKYNAAEAKRCRIGCRIALLEGKIPLADLRVKQAKEAYEKALQNHG